MLIKKALEIINQIDGTLFAFANAREFAFIRKRQKQYLIRQYYPLMCLAEGFRQNLFFDDDQDDRKEEIAA